MKNVTEIFNKVISSHTDWMLHSFYSILETLRSHNLTISFWEDEENWAAISIGNKTAGYIWCKYPLIVFEKKYIPKLNKLLSGFDAIDYIEVDSLTKDLFQIDDLDIIKFFDGYLDLNSFTMEDLWFYTNSR